MLLQYYEFEKRNVVSQHAIESEEDLLGPIEQELLIPIFRANINIPLGVSIFQTQKEIESTLSDIVKHNARWTRHIDKLNFNLSLDDDRIEDIPLDSIQPSPKHSFCGICNCNYTEYFAHINSKEHSVKVKMDTIFLYIDDLIDEFNAKNFGPKSQPTKICNESVQEK